MAVFYRTVKWTWLDFIIMENGQVAIIIFNFALLFILMRGSLFTSTINNVGASTRIIDLPTRSNLLNYKLI